MPRPVTYDRAAIVDAIKTGKLHKVIAWEHGVSRPVVSHIAVEENLQRAQCSKRPTSEGQRRRRQIAELAGQGLSQREIARALGLSDHVVSGAIRRARKDGMQITLAREVPVNFRRKA